MKVRIAMTIMLLVMLIVAALALAPGPRALAEPPVGTTIELVAPAP